MNLVQQLAALGPGKPLLPSESNVSVLGMDQSVAVVDGAVTAEAHRSSGVHLLLGRGATLAGVARAFVDLIGTPWMQSGPVALDAGRLEDLGEELFRFATGAVFGSPVQPVAASMAPLWASGTLLPIPLLRQTAGGTTRLVADLASIRAVLDRAVQAGTETRVMVGSLLSFDPFSVPLPFEVFTVDDGTARSRPTPVPGIDPTLTARDAVRAAFDADTANQAATWRTRLVWNPFAACMPVLHLLSTLPASGRRTLIGRLLGTADGPSDHQLELILATSAGAAVARAVLYHGDTNAQTGGARDRLLARFGAEAANVTTQAVAFGGAEPPSPSSANVSAQRKDGLVYTPTLLGREVRLRWGSYKQDSGSVWSGPADAGSVTPGRWAKPEPGFGAALTEVGHGGGGPLSTQALADRLRVIRAICEIEGYGDAIRAQDRALVSVGLQQYSFHVAEEATVLFRRLRAISDFWFDVFFRSVGIDVGRAPQVAGAEVDYATLQGAVVKATAVPELPRPAPSGATAAELDDPAWLIALGAAGQSRWCVPGRVGLVKGTNAAGKPTTTPAFPAVTGEPGQVHTDCHTAFGYQGMSAGRRTEDLLARWAVAARLVPEATRAQIETGLHRFTRLEKYAASPVRIQTRRGTATTGDVWEVHTRWEWLFGDLGVPVTLADLLDSPAHAAVVVDCFINTPAHALGAARRAFERAAADWRDAQAASVPVNLSDDGFRLRFLMTYLSERLYYTGSEPRRAMSKPGTRQVTWRDFSRRGGTNNVAADRIARLLARINEAVPPPPGPADLEPRGLSWRAPFAWR